MANTVTLLSYANTFGDWVVTTNALARENNDLASNNYTKSTGTLYLNDPSLGLQVANNAIVAGQLQVQGTGSSAYIQNNLRVDTQVYFQNTILGLTNSGEMISNGKVSANAAGLGLSVANNTIIGGTTLINKTLTVVGATALGNTLSVVGATALGNTLSVVGAATMASTLDVTNNGSFGNNVTVVNDTISYNFFAENQSNTKSLIVRGDGYVANVFTINNILSVANTAYINSLQANSSVNTATATITGTTYTGALRANNSINTTILNVSGTEYVDTIFANNAITSNTITVGTGGLRVIGNFTINGTTIYDVPTFTLSASTPNQIAFLNVYRSPGANASIRWNDTNKYWDIRDVDNPTSFSKILTANLISDSVVSTSTSTLASSLAAKTLTDNIITANTSMKSYVDNANSAMKVYVDNGTTSLQNQVTALTGLQSGINLTQNTTITQVNQYAASGYATANGANGLAAGAFNAANTVSSNLSALTGLQVGINLTQNTTTTQVNQYAASAYGQANTTASNLAATILYSQGIDNSQNTTITAVNGYAAGAFNTANNRVSSVSGTSGRITSSGGLTPSLDLAAAGPGATSASYSSVSIDAYGRVTALSSGTAPVTSITGTASQITVSGTTTPTLSLPQSIATGSSVQFGSFGVGTGASGTAGEIRATNNITAYYSDDRLKTKLGNIENALSMVSTLNGFYYEANQTAQDLGYTVQREVGLSAQEVQKILPEIVVPAPISDKYLTIHYEKIIPLLVEAIKELSREVEELKKK